MPLITVLIAGMDAFNPCAFFVLFFLLSLMALHRSRTRMLTVGLTFVVCSGVMYFLFMVAWLNVFLFFEQLIYLTVIAGGLALLIGLINIKDYFYFKQGVSLTISATAQQKLFARMRSISQAESPWLMLAATVILAIAANSYELLCTAGLPMVYTRLFTMWFM
jgi:asparagine N-glycosylation enzyme membrane subunit Stt3